MGAKPSVEEQGVGAKHPAYHSNEEEDVAGRLGISVERIVENQLKAVYDVRVRFKDIFDTPPDRATAEEQLAELRVRTEPLGLEFSRGNR